MSLQQLYLFQSLQLHPPISSLSNHQDRILQNLKEEEFQKQQLFMFCCSELIRVSRSFKLLQLQRIIYLFSFSMRKNLSISSLTTPALNVKSLTSPQNGRKIQGFDKASTLQSFNSKIQKIKNKPKKQSLQDQYVKGLQDQIHYLQMQLKLLKQKQIAKHSQVDQLETFFGDGIPINENILAMKNGFNNYKLDINKKIIKLQGEKKERQQVIEALTAKVSEISKQIHDKEKKYKECLTKKSDITHQKVRQECLLQQQTKAQDQNLRIIKAENRKLAQSILALERAKQILFVGLFKIEGSKYNKLNKIKESISIKQKQYDQLAKTYEKLRKQQNQKSYVIEVDEQNLKIKKKIISLEKELNALLVKIEQKKMQLDAKLKERHKQILARIDMQQRVDVIKQSIDKENNLKIEDLQKIANQKVALLLKDIVDKNKKLLKYVDHYTALQSKVQNDIYENGGRKPNLKRELQTQQNQVKIFQKDLQKQQNLNFQLKSEIQKYESKNQHISQIVPPLVQAAKKQQDKIRIYKLERERLIQEIKVKQKQLQLTQLLKSLNLEQTQISNSSNASIQDRLADFMRNWEAINRE